MVVEWEGPPPYCTRQRSENTEKAEAAAEGGTKAAEKKPLCEEKEHKRVLDKGKPADAEPVTRHPAAPASPGS